MYETRWVGLCLLFLFDVYIRATEGNNVEIRTCHIFKPDSADAIWYGASTAVTPDKSVQQPAILFIGAPRQGGQTLEFDPPDGAVYQCSLQGAQAGSGTTLCSQRLEIAKQGGLGLSLDLYHDSGNIVACAPQYIEKCTVGDQVNWMFGACFQASQFHSFELQNPCRAETVCPPLKVDIVFVIDHSGSVGSNAFKNALTWVNRVFENFKSEIESGDIRAGVIKYGFRATEAIRLQTRSYTSLTALVTAITFEGGGTATRLGIYYATLQFNNYGRPGVPRLMILMTDGAANSRSLTIKNADIARSKGILVLAVGVGSANQRELQLVAGSPDNVLEVENYDALGTILETLTNVITEAAEIQLEGAGGNFTSELINCQLGLSVSSSKTSSPLVGAVGSFDRAGSFAEYQTDDLIPQILNLTGLETIMSPENITQLRDSYLGYSVASGDFLGNGMQYIASGSPRYHSKGQVVILIESQMTNPTSSYYSLHPNGQMWQLGAYFGQSVLVLDVNGDTYDDLLVSAPLYSDVNGYDQGRVFVYLNDPEFPGPQRWSASSFVPEILSGSGKSDSRFGFSLATPGDLDQNGYNDVIVGAPREEATESGAGAIYVYYANANGISDKYKQRILGSTVANNLFQFGFNVARLPQGGIDVDKNSYPDVVVSAPNNNSVLILTSRPIVDVESNITFLTGEIDIMSCLKDVSAVCGRFRICSKAISRRNSSSSDAYAFDTAIVLDSLTPASFKRIALVANASLPTTLHSVPKCQNMGVTLNPAAFSLPDSLTTPLRIDFSYDFVASHRSSLLSAVLDPFNEGHDFADWPVNSGCLGEFCVHDLGMNVRFSIPENTTVLVLKNSGGYLNVSVTLINNGPDDSILTRVNINTNGVKLTQVVGSCIEQSLAESLPDTAVLVMSTYGSLLLNQSKCSFNMIFSLDELRTAAAQSKFSVSGLIYSRRFRNQDENASNDGFQYELPVLYEVNLNLLGFSLPEIVTFNFSSNASLIRFIDDGILGQTVHHTQMIANRGPNTLSLSTFNLTWPQRTKTNYSLFYLYHFACSPQSICSCESHNLVNNLAIPLAAGSGTFLHPVEYPAPEKSVVPKTLDCGTVKCATIRCYVSNLTVHQTVKVDAYFKIWFPTLSQKNLDVSFFSNLDLDTSLSPISPQIKRMLQGTTKVKSFVPPTPSTGEDSNIGAIIGGILGGLGLVCLLAAILWKAGFFKSKYKEMIAEVKAAENQDNMEITVVED